VPENGDLHVLSIRRRTDPEYPEHPAQQHKPDTADQDRRSCHLSDRAGQRRNPLLAPFRLFAEFNYTMYERMWGPNEFTVVGTHQDYDVTKHLGELAAPMLFLCGRHDEARPEETSWYQRLVPGAELVVFEHSSHMPHLEEPERYQQVLRDFLHGAEETSTR
jgi:proline iminopeptidase